MRKSRIKEQSKSQEAFEEFQGVDRSKTLCKKPRHVECFNPKIKQHRPPNTPWLNRKGRFPHLT